MQIVRKQMVSIKLDVEDRYGKTLSTDHALLAWLARHSSWLIARFAVKLNGRSSYADVLDQQYRGELLIKHEYLTMTTVTMTIRIRMTTITSMKIKSDNNNKNNR